MACAFENMYNNRHHTRRYTDDGVGQESDFTPFHGRWGPIFGMPAFIEHIMMEPSQTGRCGRSRRPCKRFGRHPYTDSENDAEKKQSGAKDKKVMKIVTSDWEESVDMTGFTEDDINVRRLGSRLVIQAVQEGGHHDSSWGYSKRELVRSLELPDNLMLSSLKTELTNVGQLKITGKKVERKLVDNMKSQEASSSESALQEKQASEDINQKMIHEENITEQRNSHPASNIVDRNIESNPHNSEHQVMEMSDQEEDKTAQDAIEEKPNPEPNPECCVVAKVKTSNNDCDCPIFDEKVKVTGFRPDDVSVKMVDNTVLVVADSKQESDGVILHRHLEKSFVMPHGVNPDSLHSILSPEGILTISTAKKDQQLDKDMVMSIEMKENIQK